MIRAILWDNDGVLVDTEHLYFLATKDVLATIGINFTLEQYVELFLIEGRGAWHLAKEQGLSVPEIEQLRTARNDVYGKLLGERNLVMAGVSETLGALEGKYLMAIVTGSESSHFQTIHHSTGLLKYFAFTITSENYSRFKPDPEPYLIALEKSGVDARECVAVEDSERGLIAATSAGIRCLVVPTSMTCGGNFSAATRVLSSVSEVVDVVSGLE